jgi:hypothetical protein
MMCWVALDRAVRLAETGQIPATHARHWEDEAAAVRAFVDEHCWSEAKRSSVRSTGVDELDASLLLGVLFGFADPKGSPGSGHRRDPPGTRLRPVPVSLLGRGRPDRRRRRPQVS